MPGPPDDVSPFKPSTQRQQGPNLFKISINPGYNETLSNKKIIAYRLSLASNNVICT